MKKISFVLPMLLVVILSVTSCKTGTKGSNSKNIVTLNTGNFDNEIAKGIVMVDFWATWCMPCKAMAPVIDEIADQAKGKIKVGKVDIDANAELANRYQIQGIPNIIIFKDGEPVENLVGIQSKETLIQALEKYISLSN